MKSEVDQWTLNIMKPVSENSHRICDKYRNKNMKMIIPADENLT